MDKSINRNGLVNMLILLVAAVVCVATARFSGLLSGHITAFFLAIGFSIAGWSFLHIKLVEREQLEKLEIDELARSSSSASIFEKSDSELLIARKTREQFERYFVPGFTVLLMLLEGLGCVYFYNWLGKAVLQRSEELLALGIYGVIGLTLFIIGKYSAGIVKLKNAKLLSPGANHLLLGAYLLGLNIVSIIGMEAGFEQGDIYFAKALCILLGLLAVENFFSLLLEIYRPKVKGKEERLLYESRLVGLLSKPEGVFTTAAHVLDYQFGFKVSETWVYKFLREALPLLILCQVFVLELSTCIVVIEVGEKGLMERFGKPVGNDILEPGLHIKLPWPVDKVRRFRTDQIQTIVAGMEHAEETEEEKEHKQSNILLWTTTHGKKDFLLLVASRSKELVSSADTNIKRSPPVNLMGASIPVQFQIHDLNAWAYNHQDPETLLKHIATRELVKYLLVADYDEIISTRRLEAAEELKNRIQLKADELNLGIKVLHVGTHHLHPPAPVASAYEEVVGAKQKQEANILSAQAYAIQTNAMALAEAVRKTNEAVVSAKRLTEMSRSQASAFTNQLIAFRAAPEVYKQRTYLQRLVRGSSTARKYVMLSTNIKEVIQFNLEENIRPELLESAARALKTQ